MTKQEKWNHKHPIKCRKAERKYQRKIYQEAKKYRLLNQNKEVVK